MVRRISHFGRRRQDGIHRPAGCAGIGVQPSSSIRSRGLRGILEIGAGTGMHTLGLVVAIDDVTAIDISPDLLKVAKRRAPRAKYRLMDGHAPEFSPGTFDAVLGVSILHHLNWDIAVANYFRLLRVSSNYNRGWLHPAETSHE
jgi:SAM-dependent methyltransferase